MNESQTESDQTQPRPDPLAVPPEAVPSLVRIRLSQAASDALAAVGQGAFIIACQGSYPDSAGRYVIHAVPIAWQAACDACDVLLGRATARRVKPASNPDKP
jgi:hypothetical protein